MDILQLLLSSDHEGCNVAVANKSNFNKYAINVI
jgi:hypothetical protein